MILCFDLDFSRLVALRARRTPSVITLRTSSRGALAVNHRLTACLDEIEAPLSAGAIVTTEDARVRVRPLSVKAP